MKAFIAALFQITKANKAETLKILFAAIGVLSVATEALKAVAAAVTGTP